VRVYKPSPRIQFRIGDVVRLSKLGRARCPDIPEEGTVKGFSSRATAVKVLMTGRKTTNVLHITYLEHRQVAAPGNSPR